MGSHFLRRGLSRTGCGVADVPLDTAYANSAAAIRDRAGVSVADAHLGAVVTLALATEITVITSDPRDMQVIAGDTNVTIVTI